MIPDYQTLMLPILRVAADGETRVPDVSDKIADEFGLSDAERDELLPSGRQRVLHNRIHWSKFYLSKAGLVAFPAQGRFVATDAGRALLAHPPERIDTRFLETYPVFRAWYQKQAAPEIEGSAVSAEPGLPIAVAQATRKNRSKPPTAPCTRHFGPSFSSASVITRRLFSKD